MRAKSSVVSFSVEMVLLNQPQLWQKEALWRVLPVQAAKLSAKWDNRTGDFIWTKKHKCLSATF